MTIQVNFFGRRQSRAVATFARDLLARALGRFVALVRDVHVRVRDVNGRRGGVDQLCSLDVRLADGGHLYLSDLAGQPESALRRLARRSKRILQRRARRPRTEVQR